MKKNTTILALILVSFITANAQRNYFKKPEKVNTDKYTLEFKDGIATKEECKLAVIIQNKTTDILLLKHGESTFFLNNKELNAESKTNFIYPNRSGKKVLRIRNGENYYVENFKLKFGGLYSISTSGNAEVIENFQLPAKKNQITTDNFTIKLLKLKKKTQETSAVFECKYTGSDYGIIDPSKLSVIGTDKKGNDIEYANDNTKNKLKVLRNGDVIKITAIFHIEGRILDMQFATIFIKWNDTFINSKSVTLENHNIEFQLDEILTKEKN